MSLQSELSDKRLKYRKIHRKSILDRFCEIQSSKKEVTRKYFSQMWEGYTWAAIIGFINGKRSPLGSGTDSSFNFSVINNKGGELADALVLLALAKSELGYKALNDPDEIIQVIEEYANGGFEIIQSVLMEDDGHFNNPDAFTEELLERKEA